MHRNLSRRSVAVAFVIAVGLQVVVVPIARAGDPQSSCVAPPRGWSVGGGAMKMQGISWARTMVNSSVGRSLGLGLLDKLSSSTASTDIFSPRH